MDTQVKEHVAVLVPVVLFLTVALVGVMVVSAYYVDKNGLVSLRPVADHPSMQGSRDEYGNDES